MSVTIRNMELVHADNLTPDQLMAEDLIMFGDSLVEVINVDSDSTGDTYYVEYIDDYGDNDTAEFYHTDKIKLFVYIDRD